MRRAAICVNLAYRGTTVPHCARYGAWWRGGSSNTGGRRPRRGPRGRRSARKRRGVPGGTQGLDVVPPLVQQGVEPVRDARGVALGHATHGLGSTHRHDARLDRHGDAGGARLVEEAVEVLIVVEELGNQVSDAGINLDFEVFGCPGGPASQPDSGLPGSKHQTP